MIRNFMHRSIDGSSARVPSKRAGFETKMIKICFPLPSGIKRWEDQDMVKIIFLRLCSTKIELRFFRVMRSQQQVVLTLKAARIFLSTFNGY